MGFEDLEKSEGSLDALLEEVKSFVPSGTKAKRENERAETVKRAWSIDDIDRLIAETSGSDAVARAFGPLSSFNDSAEADKTEKNMSASAPNGDEDALSRIYFKKTAKELKEEAAAALSASSEKKSRPEPLPEQPVQAVQAEPTDIFSDSSFEKVRNMPVEKIAAENADDGKTRHFGKVETADVPGDDGKTKAFVLNIGEVKAAEQEQHIPDYDPLAMYEQKLREEREQAMETDDNRRSFITPMKLEPAYEPPEENGPVEKPGILVEKSHAQMTSGLEPLPKVISADKVLSAEKVSEKTIVVGASEANLGAVKDPEAEEFPGQMMLNGFDETQNESVPDVVDEFEVEAQLLEKRRLRAMDFKIVPEEEEEAEEEEPADDPEEHRLKKRQLRAIRKENSKRNSMFGVKIAEYNEPGDRRPVHASVNSASGRFSKQIVVGVLLEVMLAVLMFLPSILSSAEIKIPFFSSGGAGIYIVSAILLIVGITSNSAVFSSGLSKIAEKQPNSETAAALSAIAAFIHNTVIAVLNGDHNTTAPVFAMAAIFGFIMINAAGLINCSRILRNFELCAYKYEKGPYVVRSFDDEAEQREMSRGLMMEKAELLYSAKTGFPSDFVLNSGNTSAERRAVGVILPLAAAASLVTAVVAFIISPEHSIVNAFTVFAGTFCACSPVLSSFVPAVAAKAVNNSINNDGSLITGIDSAEMISTANGVVIDSADIFDRSKCKMHGMIDFKKIRIDDVLVYAAALVIKSGGPLRDCFENVISSDHGLLPQVRELVYEEKLGISARIVGQKVLLGNRALLQNHGVEVPDKEIETKHINAGRKVIYLAVCGKLAAMFVVSYAVDESLRDYLERLEAAGTKILIRTNDVNVTEEMLASGFGMPKSAFCVLGSVAGRIFTNRRDEISEKCPVHLAHDGTAMTMLRTFAAVQQLVKDMDVLFVIQVILCVIGFVGAAALTGLSMISWLNGATASAFIAVSAGITALSAFLLTGKE